MCLWTRNAVTNKTDISCCCDHHILAKKIKKITLFMGMSNSYKGYKEAGSLLHGVASRD